MSDSQIEFWSRNTDEHRKGINDLEWAGMQKQGPPIYSHGDIVEFKVGGFGRIREISECGNGWPVSYSVMSVSEKPFHARDKCAWHYEGDIERLFCKASKEVADIIQQLNGDHQRSLMAHVERANQS